ncbi:permease prefix domain 1-containing protein [Butyrivibrio sp. LB2008]|uniref:permease prefix domain 1-containing protein n=1 Tax=Butyrivibrio sp. LB2008 TaxID=1408305 RepID=UPI00047CE879|nr:permease prefix domain 1-containing protein [Butyrivibrio sp. LB2008]
MEEYIKLLLEQVRFQKAHKTIAEEIRSHIEDQIEANLSEGMDRDTAEKQAVEDMGDPVEAGIALDKVHRPKLAWGVVLAAIGVGLIGTMIQFFLANDTTMQYFSVQMTSRSVNPLNGYTFLARTVVGIGIMLSVYLLDYTVISKYSNVIATVFVMFFLITYLPLKLYWFVKTAGTGVDLGYYEYPKLLRFLGEIGYLLRSNMGMLLLVPLYAGIIYKYRGQSYKALFKALSWMILPFIFSFSRGVYYAAILGSMLLQLSIAIKKEWIKVRKTPVLICMWLAYVLLIILNIRAGIAESGDESLYMSWNRSIKYIIDSMYLFGGGMYKGWGNVHIPASSFVPNPDESFVLTYISTTWGVAAGGAVFMIVIGLIVCGLVAISKCKNQLGYVMGMGCIMWLAANAIINIWGSFGMLPLNCAYATFLPFISSSSMSLYAYVALGILLSIYKYKDAYSKHVDISIRT